MTFYEILKSGKKITISGKTYDPATFDYHGGAVWVKSPGLGYFPHNQFTDTPAALDEHIKNMLADGLKIAIE